jgi:tRNA nucleotidyltransferase/poly(A) polymerase
MTAAILNHFRSHPAWGDVEEILTRLTAAGYTAVLAGGCVRDAWLGRPVADFDVATDARPEEIEKLFPKTVAIGKAFGIIKVIGRGDTTSGGRHGIDVATFRSDGAYLDGRHPSKIEFADLAGDALRRDFTINSLYFRWSDRKVVDLVGGVEDLGKKRIRAVGEAVDRFREDALRPLRAVRFAAQLNFAIEPATWNAIQELAPQTGRVAKERQMEELRKLAGAEFNVKGWELFRAAGLMAAVLPPLAALIETRPKDWQRALQALLASRAGWPPAVAIGWFAFAFGEAQVVPWLDFLKSSTEERRQGEAVLTGLKKLSGRDTSLAERLRILDGESGAWLVKLWPFARLQTPAIALQVVDETVTQFQRLMGPDGHLPAPWVNGDDLLAMGLKPGAELGRLLEAAYDVQLTGDVRDKSELLAWVRARPKNS